MKRSRLSKPECVFGAFVLFALTTVATPNIFKTFANARKAKTINNAKQIGISLNEFDLQHGEFPSEDMDLLITLKGFEPPIGDTANHYEVDPGIRARS